MHNIVTSQLQGHGFEWEFMLLSVECLPLSVSPPTGSSFLPLFKKDAGRWTGNANLPLGVNS